MPTGPKYNKDICDAIFAINPTAIFKIDGDLIYENITWHNGTTPISKKDVEAKLTELQTAYTALEYQRDRAKEYPAIGDQLDMLWHSINEDAALKSKYFKFHQAILAVKSKYSK